MAVMFKGKPVKGFHTGTFPDYTVEDHRGEKVGFTGLYSFWDPRTVSMTGAKTLSELVKWFFKFREHHREGYEADTESTNSVYVNRVLQNFFELVPDYYSRSGKWAVTETQIRSTLYGKLSQKVPKFTVEDGSSEDGFLVDFNQEPTEYRIVGFRVGGSVRIRASYSNNSNSKWTSQKQWSYKMDPIDYDFKRSFRRESDTFFGVELEVSTKLSCKEIQTIVTEVEPKQEPFFIFKYDSSISGKFENKVELVTVPCTPKYLKHNFQLFFKKLEDLCEKKGVSLGSVFDLSEKLNNGIHIHVDRNSFYQKSCPRPFEGKLRRFTAIWQTKDITSLSLLNKVCRRPQCLTKTPYSQVSHDFTSRNANHRVLSKRHLSNYPPQRESTVNLRNDNTVEIRAFQGIFDLDHILLCICFVEACLDLVEVSCRRDFGRGFSKKMLDVVSRDKKYSKLKETLTKCV